MGSTTIEWTGTPMPDGSVLPGYTFNPWTGCTKVSPACDHCYAEAWAKRSGTVQWGNHPRRRTTEANWRKVNKWDKAAKAAGKRRKVFCASLADVFDNKADPAWRTDLWGLIADSPYLDWLLLTKRPQNIANMLPDDWANGWRNVWLGTTVENQEEADRRIPHLLAVPAVVHFLSCEPLLGPVSLRKWMEQRVEDGVAWQPSAVSWVIIGGESGPGKRPMQLPWAHSLLRQCEAASTPAFFKQIDKVQPIPSDLLVRQFPEPTPCA